MQNHTEWQILLNSVREVMLRCRKTENTEALIKALGNMKRAIELSSEFSRSDTRRFLTLSTSIALYCYLRCYAYVEFDRQVLLRMSKRYPRPVFGDILNGLGMLYQEHGRINEAAQLYKQAIKLLPTKHPRFDLLVANLESLNNTPVNLF